MEGSEGFMGLTMKEKQAGTGGIAPRYRQSDKKGKTRILDEFVQATGYNRKYAANHRFDIF
jgi:hypothetical protein